MFQPSVDFYHKHRCPNCKAVNWTYHSHSERSEPIYDPEICKCHACSTRYWLMSEATVDDFYGCYKEQLEPGEDLMDVCGALEATGTPSP